MSRSFTAGGIASLLAHDSRDVWLILLTIETEHQTIYLVNNNENVVSRGNTYIAYPFAIVPPDDGDNGSPTASLTIGNTDQVIVDALRGVQKSPVFKMEVIRFDQPDTVELTVDHLEMASVTWNASTITADLGLNDIWNQPFPSGAGHYSRRQFPGMF